MKKYLLDSNVIAYWVISDKVLDRLTTSHGFPPNLVDLYRIRYRTSISLMDRIVNEEIRNNNQFFTYDFNTFEVANAIKEEIKGFYLFKEGIQFSKWTDRSEQNGLKIDEQLALDIGTDYANAMKILEHTTKVRIKGIPFYQKSSSKALPKKVQNFYRFYNWLVMRLPAIKTHDLLIISGCLADRIDFLVTKDSGLVVMNSVLEDLLEDPKLKLEIIDPGDPRLYKYKK